MEPLNAVIMAQLTCSFVELILLNLSVWLLVLFVFNTYEVNISSTPAFLVG